MRNGEEDSQIRTVFCGNVSEEVTDSILYELFNQAGPVEAVRRPKDQNGRPKAFGFIVFKHECSVPYAVELFRGTKLFKRTINVNSRDNQLPHIPVLDTHLTEFTEPQERSDARRSHNWERGQRSSRDHRSEHSRRHSSRDDRNENNASSWSELKNDPEKANKFISKYSDQDDSQSSFGHGSRHSRDNITHPAMPDFNALLQLGQQMIIPGMMGLPGISGVNNMGFGPILGNDSFPSMQGRMSGGNRLSPPREREVRDYYEDREKRDYHDVQRNRRENHERREDRRNHPYDRHHNQWEDHKRHDRGYSSSRSTHDRDKRDRRSR